MGREFAPRLYCCVRAAAVKIARAAAAAAVALNALNDAAATRRRNNSDIRAIIKTAHKHGQIYFFFREKYPYPVNEK